MSLPLSALLPLPEEGVEDLRSNSTRDADKKLAMASARLTAPVLLKPHFLRHSSHLAPPRVQAHQLGHKPFCLQE